MKPENFYNIIQDRFEEKIDKEEDKIAEKLATHTYREIIDKDAL